MNKKLNNIVVLPGDGIGPEIISQAIKVLDALKQKHNHSWFYTFADIGAVAIDSHNDPFPESTCQACKDSDAILLGAIGDPKYDNNPSLKIRPEQGLLRMRKELGLFCNIRPLRVYESLADLSPVKPEIIKDVDFVVYRELTGGIYFGEKTKGENFASDLCKYFDYEIERISRLAFEEAMTRSKQLTLIDKANVLETSRLWRSIVQKMSLEYPSVEVNYLFVDNAAMQLILNPRQFDVVLCENLFGDIISDEASVLAGSIGFLPSASKGERYCLYEPVHGSYPQAAGKNTANPLATILSVEMMLRDFGLVEEANDIKTSVDLCLSKEITTPDILSTSAYSCSQVGDAISNLILTGEPTVNRSFILN